VRGDGMEEWKEVRLEECVSLLGDGLHGTPKYTENGEYAFINGNNLINGKIVIKPETKRVNEDEYLKYKKNLTDRTIFVSINGTIGNVGTYNGEKIILGKSACYFNVLDDIDKTFIKYVVSSPLFKTYLETNATGTTIKNVSLAQMRNYSFLIPPLPTQQKIAAILSSLDDKIELNNKINDNLEQQAQAIFKSWFVDFEPFGGKMPEGWRVGKLSDISILSAGGDKPKEVSDKITEDYKVPIYSNGLDNFGLYGYTNKAKIFEESVTVSARGTIGFVCLRMVPYVPIVRLISLIPKTDFVSAKYLYLHLLNCNITGTGTTQQQLTVPAFSKEQIIIPSKNAIDSFTNTVNPFFETIVHNRKENEKLSSMRDTLLPKLMNGEIKVDEVRK